MKTLVLLTIAIACVLVLVVSGGYYVFVLRGISETAQIAERWQIERRQFLAGTHRVSPPRLYRTIGQSKILVDEYVDPFVHRDYGNDCVVYVTGRNMRDQYYAVCGDRLPVLVAEYTFEIRDGHGRISDWEIQESGLQELVDAARRRGVLLSVDEIKRRALAQPPFREGWFLKQ